MLRCQRQLAESPVDERASRERAQHTPCHHLLQQVVPNLALATSDLRGVACARGPSEVAGREHLHLAADRLLCQPAHHFAGVVGRPLLEDGHIPRCGRPPLQGHGHFHRGQEWRLRRRFVQKSRANRGVGAHGTREEGRHDVQEGRLGMELRDGRQAELIHRQPAGTERERVLEGSEDHAPLALRGRADEGVVAEQKGEARALGQRNAPLRSHRFRSGPMQLAEHRLDLVAEGEAQEERAPRMVRHRSSHPQWQVQHGTHVEAVHCRQGHELRRPAVREAGVPCRRRTHICLQPNAEGFEQEAVDLVNDALVEARSVVRWRRHQQAQVVEAWPRC